MFIMEHKAQFQLKGGEKRYRVTVFSHHPDEHEVGTKMYCSTALAYIDAANKDIQAIVLVPTQTIADKLLTFCRQMAKEVKQNHLKIRCGKPEAGKSNSKCQIIIGTSTSISTLMIDGIIAATKCKLLVLDAVKEKFWPSLNDVAEKIINQMPNKSDILLFSSTFPLNVKEFLKLPRLCRIATNECTNCMATKEFTGKMLREKFEVVKELKECKVKKTKLESEAGKDKPKLTKLESEAENRKRTITKLQKEVENSKLEIIELEGKAKKLVNFNEIFHRNLQKCLKEIEKLMEFDSSNK